ncbi:hypothetical protein BCR37DRAFT_16829 [Protomyces lactucae-debilis]|uniref:Uncharacterized protein n=1 Tax=Protomyces lactucae-debilis TaxID=2754530 RepID=A0A1Y2FV90_PROLT|nr:uncharacterized protein BCR37DRAFT_16829 [Protomyces lactucae-debilis]ORY87921.1 hypothetical protein BCR37DRAFT_16829 [Protomyces lactucae-debilis]
MQVMDFFRLVYSILQSNLTSFERTELWISRTCLTLSILIIAPTFLLMVCDLLLWVFRASEVQERTGELVSKTREGVSTLVRKKSGGTKVEPKSKKERRDSASSMDSLMSSTSSTTGLRELGKLTSSVSESQAQARQRKGVPDKTEAAVPTQG